MGRVVGVGSELSLLGEAFRVDLSNFHLAHYRRLDGFLITGKNSGSHWLKCMLSHAMARHFDLAPPDRTSGREAEDFIGHPRWPRRHKGIPKIGSSHNLPSALLLNPFARRTLKLPPVVVLVRDIPEAMLSHWVKWGAAKDLTLSQYVRLPAPGRRDLADVWWYLEFFNRWGYAAHACPKDVLIVRYEDLAERPTVWIRRIAEHFGIPLAPDAIAAAVRASGREFLKARLDPAYGEVIVPERDVRDAVRFSPADEAYLRAVLAERLRFEFGYGQARPDAPVVALAA